METRGSLSRKSDLVGFKDKHGKSAIITFAKTSRVREVKQLLENGAQVDDVDKYGMTALHHSATTNCKAIINLLIKHGANVEAQDNCNKTPLFCAVSRGRTAAAKILLQHGANANITNKGGSTALHIAATAGFAAIVRLLLDFGANVHAKDGSGQTALHYVRPSNIKVAQLLLQYGAEANEVFAFLQLNVIEVISNKNALMLPEILKYGADVNYVDSFGKTALHHAVVKDDSCTARLMTEIILEHGPDIDHVDAWGRTALHYAANKRYDVIVQLLLDNGANVNCVDEDGRTALHCAVSASDFMEDGLGQRVQQHVIVKLLLHYCANINCVDRHGCTPLQCAIKYECRGPVSALKEYIVKTKSLDIYVSERNMQYINEQDLGDFYKMCKKEVEKLKAWKLGGSVISLYDILRKNQKDLMLCTRNEAIKQDLKSVRYICEFPVYSAMIKKNFAAADSRMSLLNSSIRAFKSMSRRALPESVIMEILDYLTNIDLENVIKAGCRKRERMCTLH